VLAWKSVAADLPKGVQPAIAGALLASRTRFGIRLWGVVASLLGSE